MKHAITEEFKSIDFQIKTILRNQFHSSDPPDISFTEAKNVLNDFPDDFERGLSIFCTKMATNYSISERNDIMRKE